MKFRHSGDLGDCIFSLAILHALEGGHIFYLTDRQGITSPIKPRLPLIVPLIESQPYISECKYSETEPDCDFVNFRHFHGSAHTLLESHLKKFQMETGIVLDLNGSEPWLTADPSPKSKGRIIIAKSPRYPNAAFPWTKIVHHYGKRLLFVGLPEEHAAFVQAHGWVEYGKTKNLLDVAELIQGASLMIGNQSSPMAVALGLGSDLIQCCCPEQPDCIYSRTNAQYVSDGSCVLPDIDGSGSLAIAATEQDVTHFSRNQVPPGMWQYPGLPPNDIFATQKNLVKQLAGCDAVKADELLMRSNVNRVPDFFSDRGHAPYALFKAAYERAFKLQTK